MEDRQEQLSALLDGELDEFSTHRLLADLDEHPEWKDDWMSYALIGDVLRHGQPENEVGAAGARRALATIRAPKSRNRVAPRWVGLAVAASLTAIVMWLGHGVLAPATAPAVALNAGAAEMDRYVDMHQEIANPGLQKVSLVEPGALNAR